MKKLFALLLSAVLAITVCVPAFAATKGETVTVSLDSLEEFHDAEQVQQEVQYLKFCNDVLSSDANSLQYDGKSQTQAAAQKKLELGYISQKDYDDAVKAVTDQTDGQLPQSSQRAEDLLNLRHLLGLNDEDKLIVKPADYSTVDLDTKLSNVNYGRDLDHWMDDYGNDLDGSERGAQAEQFKSLYDALRLVSQTYQSDKTSYDTKASDAAQMQQKYDRGYATKQQVDDINRELATLSNTVARDRNSVYSAYLQYDFMRDQGSPYSSMLY